MAKKNKSESKSESSEYVDYSKQGPSEYKEYSDEIVGYWTEKGPIHFIPVTAKAFDNKIDKKHPSILIVGTLLDEAELTTKELDGGSFVGNPGDQIGVFGKPGMKALKNLKDSKVFMFPSGEKDTGKPNPMVLYKIKANGTGSRLRITEDTRNYSLDTKTFLDDSSSKVKTTKNDNDDGSDDNIDDYF